MLPQSGVSDKGGAGLPTSAVAQSGRLLAVFLTRPAYLRREPDGFRLTDAGGKILAIVPIRDWKR
jgi:hypothetical protein